MFSSERMIFVPYSLSPQGTTARGRSIRSRSFFEARSADFVISTDERLPPERVSMRQILSATARPANFPMPL